MLAAVSLAAAALFSPQIDQTSLLKQVVGVPTGKNGYEDLVAACDTLKQGEFNTYLDLCDKEGLTLDPAADATKAAVWRQMAGLTALQRRRLIATRFAPVLAQVDAASKKDIFDPRQQVTWSTLYPELSWFRRIGNFVPIITYCDFADGKSDQAVALQAKTLDIFDRLSRGSLIQYLVSNASTNILLSDIDKHLPLLSLTGATRLERCALDLTSREPAIAGCVDSEWRVLRGIVMSLGQGDAQGAKGVFDEVLETKARDSVNGVIDRLSLQERRQLAASIIATIEANLHTIKQALSGKESDWLITSPPEPEPALPSDASSLVTYLSREFMPSFDRTAKAAAVQRTRLRVLGLVAGVIRFRWEHNRLPRDLAEAVGKERVVDPLSQEPFELRFEGTGFTVLSKGTPETGEIRLRYQRPPEAGSELVPPRTRV